MRLVERINLEIARKQKRLDELREEFELSDPNHAAVQTRIMMEISELFYRIESLKNLLKGL